MTFIKLMRHDGTIIAVNMDSVELIIPLTEGCTLCLNVGKVNVEQELEEVLAITELQRRKDRES